MMLAPAEIRETLVTMIVGPAGGDEAAVKLVREAHPYALRQR